MNDEKITLTQWLNNINNGKMPFVWGKTREKCYTPFIINRALVNDISNVPLVSEINKLHHLPKKQQYLFLFNTIKKYKRPFQKNFIVSAKKTDEDILMVQILFKVNKDKAEDILNVLSKKQLKATCEHWKLLNSGRDSVRKIKST